MAVDLLTEFPGWSVEFDLKYRSQISGRTAGGRTQVVDLGQPLWRAVFQSKELLPNTLDQWRARLNAMKNGMVDFIGYSKSRCYPIAYPGGTWPSFGGFDGTNAELTEIGSDRGKIKVGALPVGFTFNVGDMLQIGANDLHRVTAGGTAGVSNEITGFLSVEPFLWPGVDPDVTGGVAVSVLKPSCLMMVEPGSVNTTADRRTGRGTVSFSALEVR